MRDDLIAGARPSFSRRPTRDGPVAVVDVGSNSVRLVVFEGASRAPAYLFNEKVACGLGSGLAETGRLAPESVERALRVLARFAAVAERMRVAALDAVATAAVRDAQDGPAFVAQVEAETGLRLRVVDGAEEARLSAVGALVGEPMAEGAVADMGGASMELAEIAGGRVGARLSLSLGPQWLAGLSGAALRKRVDSELARAEGAVELRGRTLFLVGGAWRSVAKLQMARAGHPLSVLQGYRIPAAEAAEASAWIARQPPEQLSRTPGVSAARAATAPVAAVVLGRILDRLGPSEIAVSAFGLREGVYFELLPPPVRAQDPLIEACRRLERVQARFPGFGAELFAFLEPVLAGWGKRERRLARAACYLNDVNWRAHPEYRSVSCFETVTRANLAALDHADRVFLGLALAQRYGGGKRSVEADAALALLSGPDEKRAKALGRAMRLGAMIAASTPGALAEAALAPEAGRLTLRLGRDLAPLWGDVVEKRLAALAEAMDLAPQADIAEA